ncbi:hypothetical protein L0337_18125 [candidate division KSB1 bacterium]|nr:hypothetical protein [candidate division KSB1 bacterium]
MKKLFVVAALFGLILPAGGFRIVEAQTPQAKVIMPSNSDDAKSDTVMTIASLSVDSLRLVIGLEEMQAHLARMVKMGRKAGLMWMDLKDTHIIAITVLRQQHLITDNEAEMTLKAKASNGESETREMYFITGLDSFNEGFNLATKGKYHFTILLERKGRLHRAEFTYEVK